MVLLSTVGLTGAATVRADDSGTSEAEGPSLNDASRPAAAEAPSEGEPEADSAVSSDSSGLSDSSDASTTPPGDASHEVEAERDTSVSSDGPGEGSADSHLSESGETSTTRTQPASDGEVAESGTPPRRSVPDLDGRPPSDANAVADAFLWIPRILTGPLYLVSEYLIRVPLGAALYELERAGLLDWLFASGGDVTILPTLFFEFGLSASVGIYAALDHFPFTENRISVHAATWGEDWLRLIVRDRIQLTSAFDLALRFEGRRRPDQLIEGIGHDATQVRRARFGVEWIEARAELSYRLFGRTRLNYQLGYRAVGFYDTNWGGDPSVTERGGALPTGYESGYELVFGRADLLLDTHQPRGELTRARFRVRALVELNGVFGGLTAADPRQLISSFVRYGGEVAASTDFLGRGRVLMLRFRTELVSPLNEQDVVPFYELPDAGGKGPLGGFVTGQLRGESILGLTLEYVWPVYALLDGFLQMTVGNAFGRHYEGFEWDRLRLGWGIGIVPRFEGEHLVEISFGIGTETFENGTDITQARVVVGARHGL